MTGLAAGGAPAERGERVRCLARRPRDVAARMSPGVEVVGGDVLDASSLARVLEGVDTAFYLVHGMGSRSDFHGEERRGATNFALAARAHRHSRTPTLRPWPSMLAAITN